MANPASRARLAPRRGSWMSVTAGYSFATISHVPSLELLSTTMISYSVPAVDLADDRVKAAPDVILLVVCGDDEADLHHEVPSVSL